VRVVLGIYILFEFYYTPKALLSNPHSHLLSLIHPALFSGVPAHSGDPSVFFPFMLLFFFSYEYIKSEPSQFIFPILCSVDPLYLFSFYKLFRFNIQKGRKNENEKKGNKIETWNKTERK